MAKDRCVDLVPFLKGRKAYSNFCKEFGREVGKYPVSLCIDDVGDNPMQVRLGLDTNVERFDAENYVYDAEDDDDAVCIFSVQNHPNCCGMSILHTFGTVPSVRTDMPEEERKAFYSLLDEVVSLISDGYYDRQTYKQVWYTPFNGDGRVELIGVHRTRATSAAERAVGMREPVDDPDKLKESLFMGWVLQHKIVNSYVFYNSNSGNFCQGMTALITK